MRNKDGTRYVPAIPDLPADMVLEGRENRGYLTLYDGLVTGSYPEPAGCAPVAARRLYQRMVRIIAR